jgi:maleylacetate reductase
MHHKICHVLGGRWNLPHAQTHAVVLPHVVAFNAPAAKSAAARITTALGSDNALNGLTMLQDKLDAPAALKDFGFAEENIAEAVQLILPAIPDSNPRPVTEENLSALLGAACAGNAPGVGTRADALKPA